VRADEVNSSASNRRNADAKSGMLHDPLTGVVNVSEPVEMSTGTWEVHKSLQGSSIEAEK
jgi:hypothetical protein